VRATAPYPGIDDDHFGGMTDIGRIIRDAWVLGVLPESQTCAGWDFDRLQQLYDDVTDAWQPYGHLVSQLPGEMRERHQRIQAEAMLRAREAGWEPPMETD
jgi:hypothetical protein